MIGFFSISGGIIVLLASGASAAVAWYLSRNVFLRKYHTILDESKKNFSTSVVSERQLYKNLLDHTSDGVVLMDKDYTIIEVNKSFLRMFEFAETEIKGKPLYQYILSDAACSDSNQEALIRTEHDAYETVRIKKNGDPIIVKITTFTVDLSTDAGEKQFICSQYTDVTEIVKKEKRITELAYYDALTSLPNRYLLESKAEEMQMMGGASRYSFVFMDLNGFKHINDTLGHEYGDALLVAFCKRVRGNIKQDDFFARIGGDEFVLLLPHTPRKIAYKVVERIHKMLENPFMIKGQRIFVGVAAGITGYPEDSSSIEELQRFADIAMYTAKQQHIPYMYYEEQMHNQYKERLALEQNLIMALKHQDEIILHYLPVIDLKDSSILSFEALCRWNHPELGLIPSSKFIPMAEETQLIYDIGDLVLKKAFKQAYLWQRAGYDFSVTINLSAKELVLPNTISKIKRLIRQYSGVEEFIELEITEAMSMLNLERGKAAVKELKEMGFKIILDDFGSGYSSLNFLRDLHVDRLKIDKLLIDDAAHTNATSLILKGLLHIANVMNIDIIAEGVSTLEQKQLLESIGFRYLQGFLFSEPVPASEVTQVIDRLSQGTSPFAKNVNLSQKYTRNGHKNLIGS